MVKSNHVPLLTTYQAARYLVKSFRQGKDKNTHLADSVQYLKSLEQQQKGMMKSNLQIDLPQNLVEQFEQVAFGQISEAVQQIDDSMSGQHRLRSEDAWNNTSVELTGAAIAHLRYFVVKTYAYNLSSANNCNLFSDPVAKILLQLFEMLSLSWMQDSFGNFLRHTGVQVGLEYRRVQFNTYI